MAWFQPFHVPALAQGWQPGQALPQPLSWFGVAYDGYHALVIGGRDAADNPVATVYRAPMFANGSMGSWETTQALPKPLLGHAVTSQGNTIYVLGGWSQGGAAEQGVYYTPSTAISWRQGESLPMDLYQGAAVATGTHLYHIGGFNLSHRAPVNTILMADLAYNGRPTHWRAIRPLPRTLYRHTAFIHDHWLYVVGGYDGQTLSSWIYYAELQPDGNLGPWNQARLPIPREYAQAIPFQDRLILLGGRREGGLVLRSTYLADFAADGSLSHWRTWLYLPRPLYRFGALALSGRTRDALFILGGRDGTNTYRSEVYSTDMTSFRPHLFLPAVQRHPTPIPTPTPTPGVRGYLWWQEAEAGHPVPPIGLGYDQTDSACKHLYAVDDFSSGGAQYTFRVPESNQYMIWARVKGKGYAENSWSYSLDDGTMQTLSVPPFQGEWTWGWMKLFGGRPQSLSIGKHTLQFFSREVHTGLDAVLVTDILDYIPTQKTNCPSLPSEPMGLVNDGSFENGPPPASAWEEDKNTACEWIGNWPTGAYHGAYDFWAGGYCKVDEHAYPNSNSVSQLLYVPRADPTLYFYYLLIRIDSDDPIPDDYAYVQVNGDQVWQKYLTDAQSTYAWVGTSVDLSAYAGQIIELKLGAHSQGELTGNIHYDYIQLGYGARTEGTDPMPTPSPLSTPNSAFPSLHPVPKRSSP